MLLQCHFLLSAHSVALWVTVALSNKLQSFSLRNQHPPTACVCTKHRSDPRSTMMQTQFMTPICKKIKYQSVIYSLSGVRFFFYIRVIKHLVKLTIHTLVRSEVKCSEEALFWLASVINDLFNSPKAKSQPRNMSGPVHQLCDLLRSTPSWYTTQTVFHVPRRQFTHAALTYFLLLRLHHSLRNEVEWRQRQN